MQELTPRQRQLLKNARLELVKSIDGVPPFLEIYKEIELIIADIEALLGVR